jgi:tRNA threonylcarbamoyladenosine biosynthesis protein TsaB
MYILSVDTTAKSATVCVAKSDEISGVIPIAQLNLNSTATHSESLLPMIDKALELSSLKLSDINCFAITAGPGSFTGVRIGVSAIKGLAFASGDSIPCIPLSTLYCLTAVIH